MASTVYYWNVEGENKKINVDDMKKAELISALKEMIKLSSLDQSSKDRYELANVTRQFHDAMLDYQEADEPDTDNPY